jgi:alanyl-tRNA synthetase
VGPDALRQINVERRLLEETVTALGGGDPEGAPERARRAVERIKQLESELGKLRRGDRAATVDSLAAGAERVDGVALVVAAIPGEDASGLRELAQAVRQRLEGVGPGAVVLASADGSGAKLAAACTTSLVQRGLSAQELLDPAARAVGGGAGGKPILAMAGGRDASNLDHALGLIPARLEELLARA